MNKADSAAEQGNGVSFNYPAQAVLALFATDEDNSGKETSPRPSHVHSVAQDADIDGCGNGSA